jgi:hypothetical protein
MGSQSHIYRRPSGVYVIRVSVPERHRARVGRGEIHVSTQVRDYEQATITALSVVLEWKRRFLEFDRTLLPASAVTRSPSGNRSKVPCSCDA